MLLGVVKGEFGVAWELLVDHACDVALEASDGFFLVRPWAMRTGDVDAGAFVVHHAGEHNAPECRVGLSVAARSSSPSLSAVSVDVDVADRGPRPNNENRSSNRFASPSTGDDDTRAGRSSTPSLESHHKLEYRKAPSTPSWAAGHWVATPAVWAPHAPASDTNTTVVATIRPGHASGSANTIHRAATRSSVAMVTHSRAHGAGSSLPQNERSQASASNIRSHATSGNSSAARSPNCSPTRWSNSGPNGHRSNQALQEVVPVLLRPAREGDLRDTPERALSSKSRKRWPRAADADERNAHVVGRHVARSGRS